MLRLLGYLRNLVLTPKVRLEANFPWSFGKSLKTYGVATLLYVVGTMTPVLVFSGLFRLVAEYRPEWLVSFSDHQIMLLFVGVAVFSFISGFGLELWYIRRQLKAENVSVRKALALNLDSLNGSWLKAFGMALLAFAVLVPATYVVESLLPVEKIHDPAADFARQLVGGSVWLFAFLGVVVAPVLEELVFRGFVYNMLRTSMRSERWLKVLRSHHVVDFMAGLVSAAIFGLFHMNWSDPSHLNWPALPVYMVTGMILSELYRRSGTLYAPMMLHAMNNLAVVILTYAVASH